MRADADVEAVRQAARAAAVVSVRVWEARELASRAVSPAASAAAVPAPLMVAQPDSHAERTELAARRVEASAASAVCCAAPLLLALLPLLLAAGCWPPAWFGGDSP